MRGRGAAADPPAPRCAAAPPARREALRGAAAPGRRVRLPLPAGALGPRVLATRRPGGRSARPPPFSSPRRQNATARRRHLMRALPGGAGAGSPSKRPVLTSPPPPRARACWDGPSFLQASGVPPPHPHPGLGRGNRGELGLRMGAPSRSRRPLGVPSPRDGQPPPDVTRAGKRRLAGRGAPPEPGRSCAPSGPPPSRAAGFPALGSGPGPAPAPARPAQPARLPTPPHPRASPPRAAPPAGQSSRPDSDVTVAPGAARSARTARPAWSALRAPPDTEPGAALATLGSAGKGGCSPGLEGSGRESGELRTGQRAAGKRCGRWA